MKLEDPIEFVHLFLFLFASRIHCSAGRGAVNRLRPLQRSAVAKRDTALGISRPRWRLRYCGSNLLRLPSFGRSGITLRRLRWALLHDERSVYCDAL
jgi:hypothetical protein